MPVDSSHYGGLLSGRRRQRRIVDGRVFTATLRGPAEHAVLELSGEFDFSKVDQFEHAVGSATCRVVSIDLTGLDFVDIAAIRCIRRVSAELARKANYVPAIEGLEGPRLRAWQLADEAQRAINNATHR
jgi:hypothetical protein